MHSSVPRALIVGPERLPSQLITACLIVSLVHSRFFAWAIVLDIDEMMHVFLVDKRKSLQDSQRS